MILQACVGRFPTEATVLSNEVPHAINCTYEITVLPVITWERCGNCGFNSYPFWNSRGGFKVFISFL